MALSHGMNIDEIEAFGRRLQTHFAAELNKVASEIETIVGQTSGSWIGPDAEKFRSWWPAKRSTLRAAAEDINGFGQSALNNVAEQRQASGDGGASGGPIRGFGPIGDWGSDGGIAPPGVGRAPGEVIPPRSWQDAQEEYDAWATGRFAEGGESHYQCTGWANFRWQQLGYEGDISGHGGAMAGNAGPTTGEPSLHAMASYGGGDYGHVMIVEEVMDGGNTIRVSEMNVGDDNYEVGRPEEYRDTEEYSRDADGVFRAWNGAELEFAAFPG